MLMDIIDYILMNIIYVDGCYRLSMNIIYFDGYIIYVDDCYRLSMNIIYKLIFNWYHNFYKNILIYQRMSLEYIYIALNPLLYNIDLNPLSLKETLFFILMI